MSTVADVVEPVDNGAGASLRVTASLDVLAEVRAFVRSTVSGLGADKSTAIALVQSVDEWVTNVVVHGYRGPGPVEVTIRREGADILVRVGDQAPAYDPATARPFDPAVPLDQRPFGGMGIALIKDLCTVFEHRSLLPAAGNEVTMRRPATTPVNDGGAQ